VPPHSDNDTSLDAAEAARKNAAKRRAKVRAFITSRGAVGATDDEIEVGLGYPHQTASARRRELVLLGLVRDSGLRRLTRHGRAAKVWVIGLGGAVLPAQGRRVEGMPSPAEMRQAMGTARLLWRNYAGNQDNKLNARAFVRVCLWLGELERELS
jgi:hypothetical protein